MAAEFKIEGEGIMLNLRNRGFFKELLEAQYLAKFIKRQKLLDQHRLPSIPVPDPGPFIGSSDLQPSLLDPRDALLGDLLINALGDPEPQPNRPLYINQIRESGLHGEVIKELITQFEDGTKALKGELEILENNKKC